MIKKLIFLFFVLSILFVNIHALDLKMDIKNSFSLGDLVSFNYTILSISNQQVEILPYIFCPNAPIAVLKTERVFLKKNVFYKRNYNDITLTSSIESQNCTAYIKVLSPLKMIVSKNFSIITDPSFSLKKKLPAEKTLIGNKKVYVVGENIYFDYIADISDAKISANLVYPDKTTKKVSFPLKFKANQIGSYTLDITASKEGYKTIKEKEQFAVIKKNIVVKSAFEKGNPKLTGKTIVFNKSTSFDNVLLVFITVIIVFIILFLFKYLVHLNLSKRNNKKKS